ncbi:MAG: hypothetical protein RLZZ450_4619 [Pseudomonadota bacterium]
MAALQVRRLQSGRSLSARAELAWLGAALLALYSAWLAPSSAAAHGIAPRALAPLQQAADGVRLVRLTRGLAWRADDGFRYFCPAHWDGSENVPVSSMAEDLAVLALPNGLFLLGPDGSSTPYPEPNLGNVVALASAANGAYALALRGDRYELRRLARDKSELLWSSAQSEGLFTALGAGESVLVLMGLRAGVLTQLTLRSDGSELARVQAEVGADSLSVEAAVAGTTAYAIVSSESGDRIELGRIADNRWRSLAQAVGNLSGPVADTDGKLFVAVDGALASFEGEQVVAKPATAFVTAVASANGRLYASVREGLRVLSGGALDDLVFAFEELAGPRTDLLAPPDRTACESAWQHLQVDLVAAGLLGVEASRDAGSAGRVDAATTVDAVAPGVDGGSVAVPPATHRDAGNALADADAQPATARASNGCSAHASSVRARPALTNAAWCALVGLLVLGRRRRAAV